jgi:hypothetical protein
MLIDSYSKLHSTILIPNFGQDGEDDYYLILLNQIITDLLNMIKRKNALGSPLILLSFLFTYRNLVEYEKIENETYEVSQMYRSYEYHNAVNHYIGLINNKVNILDEDEIFFVLNNDFIIDYFITEVLYHRHNNYKYENFMNIIKDIYYKNDINEDEIIKYKITKNIRKIITSINSNIGKV